MMAVIAIDFDGTISANPDGFRVLCEDLINRGHEVVIWSQRAERTEPSRSGEMRQMVECLGFWKIPYTRIDQHGKIWADLYVDDKAVHYKDAGSLHEILMRTKEIEVK